jgi:bifunctional non-homologous end joining protein LigD
MPRFIAPQLCKLVKRATSEPGWAHEIKLDGYRTQLRVENGDAQLRTRKGIDWTAKLGGMAAAASALPDCLLDGEVVALDKHGEPDKTSGFDHVNDAAGYFLAYKFPIASRTARTIKIGGI